MPTPPWIQVEIRSDSAGELSAQASAARAKGSGVRYMDAVEEDVERFAASVRRLVRTHRMPDDAHRRDARALYEDVFAEGVGRLSQTLLGEGRGELLIRLKIAAPALRAVPWEAMRGPEPTSGALASDTRIRLARGVSSPEPAVPREVRGAVRLLVVAPEDMRYAVEAMDPARGGALADACNSGQIEWLPPLTGAAARWDGLLKRLDQTPMPHIVHFVCHGRVRGDQPELLLGPYADDGDDQWTSAEALSKALRRAEQDLRLVYLESCQGADPGPLASAAERLVAGGIDAAVAHLWTVEVGAAKDLTAAFYGALAGPREGDLAAALSDARLALEGRGDPAFLSPVLYLRGEDASLFDFSRRRLQTATATPGAAPRDTSALSPRLTRMFRQIESLLAQPGALVIGDALAQAQEQEGWPLLRTELQHLLESEASRGDLYQLMQRYEMAEEREELNAVVQETLDPLSDAAEAPALIDALAELSGPGLFVTLLRFPMLETALAHHHPNAEILALQPLRPAGFERLRVFQRTEGAWRRLRRSPERFELDRQFVVLRFYGGYTAANRTLLGNPVLTDDDQIRHLQAIDQLPDQLLGFLRTRPAAILGVDPLAWQHRELIRRLTGEHALTAGSRVFLSPRATEPERRYWTAGDGPGGGELALSRIEDLSAVVAAWRREPA